MKKIWKELDRDLIDMEINDYSFGANLQELSKKSIVAYILPVSIWFVAFTISISGALLIVIFVILIGVYIVAYIRSYTLFIDDEGVWVFRGVFPWQKGIYGVKWGDFNEGVFSQNFASWVLRSFTIEVKNRYKEEPEIVLKHMHNGDYAITKMNSVFMHKYRREHQ